MVRLLRRCAKPLASLVALGCAACATTSTPTPAPTPPPAIEHSALVARLPVHVKDKAGWAEDILAAIRLTQKVPTAERACAVVAVIGQESGFVADPAVADLDDIVKAGLDDKLSALGPLAVPAREAVLAMTLPGSGLTVGARVQKLKTERDLDELFRDLIAALKHESPGSFAVAQGISLVLGRGGLDNLNPVTTAGSMQVKVDFAKAEEPNLADAAVRELLYTRSGGVRFGTARLIGYAAHYDDVVFRFADYNAGVYASRNAAVQKMVSALVGVALVADGDLLLYDKNGTPKSEDSQSLKALISFGTGAGLSERDVRKAVAQEKSASFEDTELWRAVRAAYTAQTGKPAPYAVIPTVSLSSPKLKKARTTEWFAQSVLRRYQACRGAG